MIKKPSLPVIFAAVWMFIQLLLFYFKVPKYFQTGIYFNLFFIITVIILSLYLQIRKEKKLYPFATNFKNSLKSAGTYIILVGFFLFLFLKYINPEFLTDLSDQRIENELSKDWEKVKASADLFKNMSREEFVEKTTSSSEMLSSVSLNLSFYFLAMFFLAVFFSILVPLFYKKIVLRM